jgi:hypothetical protein
LKLPWHGMKPEQFVQSGRVLEVGRWRTSLDLILFLSSSGHLECMMQVY